MHTAIDHSGMYPLVIGIAGDSGSGKTRLCSMLEAVFGPEHTLIIHGDNYHAAERGDALWQHTTHLDPVANLLDHWATDLAEARNGRPIMQRVYCHTMGRFLPPVQYPGRPVIITEGLHTLFTDRLRAQLDVAIFVEMNERLRRELKLQRDITERGYTRERILRQIDQRTPYARRYIAVQKANANIIVNIVPAMAATAMSLATREGKIALQLRVNVQKRPLHPAAALIIDTLKAASSNYLANFSFPYHSLVPPKPDGRNEAINSAMEN